MVEASQIEAAAVVALSMAPTAPWWPTAEDGSRPERGWTRTHGRARRCGPRAAKSGAGEVRWWSEAAVVAPGSSGRGARVRSDPGAAWRRAFGTVAVRKVVWRGRRRRGDGGSHRIHRGGGAEWPRPLRSDSGEAGLLQSVAETVGGWVWRGEGGDHAGWC